MPRRDLKPGAMFLFELRGCYEEGKAKTARAGPGEISVREFTQGKTPSPYELEDPAKAGFFALYK